MRKGILVEPDRDSLRVLVVIRSSGDSPYVEIERQAQETTFGSQNESFAEVVWIEGNPETANRMIFRLLNGLMRIIHMSLYGPPIEINLGNHTFFLEGHQLRKRPNSRTATENQFGIRVRLNWAHLFTDKLHSPPLKRNTFSQAISRILNALASGKAKKFGRRIQLDFPNSYFLHTKRAMLVYKTVLRKFVFDFVLLTTSTCYVDTHQLLERVGQLPKSRVYGGHLMKFEVPFIAGNSILMSRDVLEQIVRHETNYRLDRADDVALGWLVKAFDLADITDIPTEILPFSPKIPRDLSKNWRTSYLFRCKAEPKTANSEPVIATMRKLHEFIGEFRKQKATEDSL